MFPCSFHTTVKISDDHAPQEIRIEAESPDKINICFKEGDPELTNIGVIHAVRNLDAFATFIAASLFPQPPAQSSNEEATQQELPL